MSYRLGPRDEQDVRYWLGDDLRGDVGVHSQSGSFGDRAIYKPIQNFRPYQWFDGVRHQKTEDVGYRCGPIVVKPKKRKYLPSSLSETALVRVSEKDMLLNSIWERLLPNHQKTIELCYSGSPVPHGFAIFGDVAPLLYDTDGALICEQRESTHVGRRVPRLEALMLFGTRLTDKGAEAGESDQDLRTEMEIEADLRLSAACKAYTRRADDAYRDRGREKDVA